ncbi:MAG: ribulokinase [Clostridia bacterium]|nr:ribulokinase [Clostridia bacterium]
MSKYVIGIDFGTLSGRALLIDTSDGTEICSSEYVYPHGVMDEFLSDGTTRLPPNYALQDPMDYIAVIESTCPKILSDSGVSPKDIIGIGIDFTSCTIMPVWADGTPLCTADKYKRCPHAYPKLWKHHAAQPYATKFTEIAQSSDYDFLKYFGGKMSAEFAIPKIWQVLEEAPEIYKDCDFFIEGSDWIVWMLCGNHTRNITAAGYKACYNKKYGFPANEFFASLDPRLSTLVEDKIGVPISLLGSCAGGLTSEMAVKTGLPEGIAVCVGNVDGHAMVPGVSITKPGEMLMVMGTSSCQMLLSDKLVDVPGIMGVVEDGMMPGYFGYESGQAGFGDHYAWFMKNVLPYSYKEAAKNEGISDYDYVVRLAAKLSPGESGLIALDWWNGNRSVLNDTDLTGAVFGMNLRTKPEEIFRALVEATAFGTKTIIENYKRYGLVTDIIIAAGGIAEKNPFIMQVFADILNIEIAISGSPYAAALGAGIFASVAAGKAAGGWDSPEEAALHMGKRKDLVYKPIPENVNVYNSLYEQYVRLHDMFGRDESSVIKKLISIRNEQINKK